MCLLDQSANYSAAANPARTAGGDAEHQGRRFADQTRSAKTMRTLPICALLVGFLVSGCANHPKHVSAEEFQRLYRSVNTQTLDWYSYLGETNGAVYMARSRVGLFGGEPRDKVYFTETNGLPSEFLQALRARVKPEVCPKGPAWCPRGSKHPFYGA